MIYDNVLDIIGRTPMVKLHSVGNRRVNVYGKLESFNPSGSVKDRAAYFMVNDALKSGRINGSTAIIEATSGNSGISLAMVCAVKKMRCILVMPENVRPDKVKMLRAYGAEIVLTPKEKGMKGANDKAEALQKELENAYIPMQFSNKSNSDAHYATTAKEIFTDLSSVKWIVVGVGTGGTVIGLTRYIISKRIDCKICVVEPKNNPVLEGGTAGAHKIQGIGANFIPKIIGDKTFDRIEHVTDEEAIECAREMSSNEGIFCGFSSGAAIAAAKRLAAETVTGDIVVIMPDDGMRYINSTLCDYD